MALWPHLISRNNDLKKLDYTTCFDFSCKTFYEEIFISFKYSCVKSPLLNFDPTLPPGDHGLNEVKSTLPEIDVTSTFNFAGQMVFNKIFKDFLMIFQCSYPGITIWTNLILSHLEMLPHTFLHFWFSRRNFYKIFHLKALCGPSLPLGDYD